MRILVLIFSLILGSLALANPPGTFQPLLLSASSVPATVSYTASAKDETALTTYTYTSQSIGTAAVGRCVFVGTGGIQAPAQTISSVTIGGNAATAQTTNANNGNWPAGQLFSLQVDAGTTATIVVTYTGGMLSSHIGVWAGYNLSSCTATDTIVNVATSPTGLIDVQAGGIVVGWCDEYNSSGAPTWTWVGPTENYELAGTTYAATGTSGASLAYAAAQTNLTVTCTPTGTIPNAALVAGAFR